MDLSTCKPSWVLLFPPHWFLVFPHDLLLRSCFCCIDVPEIFTSQILSWLITSVIGCYLLKEERLDVICIDI